jgi:hypothetical protein
MADIVRDEPIILKKKIEDPREVSATVGPVPIVARSSR